MLVTDDDVMLICSLPCCRQGRRGQAVTAMEHVWERWESEEKYITLMNKPVSSHGLRESFLILRLLT